MAWRFNFKPAEDDMNETMQLIETKDNRGNQVYRISINGRTHPVDFLNRMVALSHMGLLRSQGFKEARHEQLAV